jgi:hypothetical protein
VNSENSDGGISKIYIADQDMYLLSCKICLIVYKKYAITGNIKVTSRLTCRPDIGASRQEPGVPTAGREPLLHITLRIYLVIYGQQSLPSKDIRPRSIRRHFCVQTLESVGKEDNY